MLSTVERTDGTSETYYTSKGYNALGQAKEACFGNGTETSSEYYDTSKRLKTLHTFKDTTDFQKLTYTYTETGRVSRASMCWPTGSGYSRPGDKPGPEGGATSDHFIDLENLVFEPNFDNYVRDAFNPLGIMLDFWEETLPPGQELDVEGCGDQRSGRTLEWDC